MPKFKVKIVETYRRYVEVEAQDEDAAWDDITNQIEEGLIDLPRDQDDYQYDRELFVSEIKEILAWIGMNLKKLLLLTDSK